MAKEVKKPTPKTQREISIEKQQPYVGSNPNSLTTTNRGYNTSFRGDTTKPINIGLQTIDEAIIYYIKNEIKPYVIQNGTRIEVPVEYAGPEKWKTYQKDGYLRDKKGKLMAPMILIKRDTVDKNYSVTNKLDANLVRNYYVYEQKYSSRNAYDNFNIINNRIPEKEYYVVVVPDYVTVSYSVLIFTYYVEHLNKIVEAFNYASDSYWGDPERYKFKSRIDNYSITTELQSGDERLVRATFDIKSFGYVVPDNIQKDLNALKKVTSKCSIIVSENTISNIGRQ